LTKGTQYLELRFRHLALDLAGPLAGFRDGDRRGYEADLEAARQL